MPFQSIPNFNQVELAFLSEFIEGTIELAEEVSGSTEKELLIRKQIAEFQNLLERGFPDDLCARIIQIEDFRNDLLEVILDRLDDTLNLFVDDPENDLGKVGLNPTQALRKIPEYSSALDILGELTEGEPDFHSRLQNTGHVWDEEHIRMLINRFESGEYSQAAEILGVAGRLKELLAVDHRQEVLIRQSHVCEEMEELRAVRTEIFSSSMALYEKIYSKEKIFKAQKKVSGTDLIVEILKVEQQVRDIQRFSPNDLTHSEFALLLEEKFPENPNVSQFRESLKLFLTSDLAKQFESNELLLYRTVERFICDLTIHLLHTETDINHPLRDKIEQNVNFMNAQKMVDHLALQGIEIPHGFLRGDAICGIDFPKLVVALSDNSLHELLMELRLRPLAEEIVETDQKSRELTAIPIRRNRGLSLLLFRNLRAELSRLLTSK